MSHPVLELGLLHTLHGVSAVLLGQPAHQTHQLLVLLTVQLQLLSVSAAAGGRELVWGIHLWQSGPGATLLQAVAVALHNVGHDSVGAVALARVHLPALGTGAGTPLPKPSGAHPVALDTGLAEGVVTGQRHGLLEQI